MISQKLQDAINEQINGEFYAAHLYLSMAAFCDTRSLGGFAHWLTGQPFRSKYLDLALAHISRPAGT